MILIAIRLDRQQFTLSMTYISIIILTKNLAKLLEAISNCVINPLLQHRHLIVILLSHS